MQKGTCPPKHKPGLTQPKQRNQKLEEHRDLEEYTFPCLEDEELFIHETVSFVDALLNMVNLQQLGTPIKKKIILEQVEAVILFLIPEIPG